MSFSSDVPLYELSTFSIPRLLHRKIYYSYMSYHQEWATRIERERRTFRITKVSTENRISKNCRNVAAAEAPFNRAIQFHLILKLPLINNIAKA